MDFDMDLLSTSTVSLVSGTFLVNFRLIRKPFLLFLAEWIYFSLFVTQLAMPTPFNVTNMDQKKPNRWAPLLNYWKVWFITVFSSPYFFEHMIQFKNWTLKGFNSLILYSSNWNFSSNWIFQENWLIEFVCNRCWRSCHEKRVATSVWRKLSKISSGTNSTLH